MNLRVGTVVPIPKGNKVWNIRPISLLPTPGKVWEHIMHQHIYQYLSENRLLSPKQTGFRKYYGIHDATIYLFKFIHNKFNEKQLVLCIFIDMAKAFNSLNISILLSKLSRLGLKESPWSCSRVTLKTEHRLQTLMGALLG